MKRAVPLAAILSLAITRSLAAQTVRGQLIEEGTGVALEGALVVLTPPDSDSAYTGALTNASGRFQLTAGPGRWRLRSERIGHGSVYSEPFELEPGEEISIRLEAPVEAIRLPGLEVPAASRGCVARPEEGLATARLWDEARKALENSFWGREGELVRFETVVYQRRLDPETLSVREEEAERQVGTGVRPFRSVPPDVLAARGFVQATDSGTYYFAPDEEVLLSDVFLDDHCFRVLRSREHPELVGLAFEPVRGAENVEIAGVLWLDEQTRELRFLEYRYENLRVDVPTDDLGGRVQFQRLPTGAWIPRRWWIRMPVIELEQIRRMGFEMERRRLVAIRERGGEVVAVEMRDGRRIEQLDRPRVQGVVYDSLRGRPLADAEVSLLGTDHVVRTDPNGRFMITAGEGNFLLTFDHPRLDTLAWEPDPQPLMMRAGVVRQVRLAVPAEETLLVEACAAGAPGTALVGSVRDGEGAPIPSARVSLAWQGSGGEMRGREERTDGRGRFAFCDAPPHTELLARALHDGRTSETLTTSVPADGVARAELRIDSLRTGRLRGHVTDGSSGEPVVGASLRLEGTDLRTLSDGDGRFSLFDVPPGRQVLRVEHLLYGIQADSLVVQPDVIVSLDVSLTSSAIVLEPLTVTAERRGRTPGQAGFYDRLERGIGHFVTEEQIRERQARQISEVLRAVPGLGVTCGMPTVEGSGCYYEFARARRLDSRTCPVVFFLDGSRTSQEIIEVLRPTHILGVEVYSGLADVPARFRRGPDTRCGVVVVWLKEGA